ncbi:MAG: hypothetical protein NPIRA01_05020 [Nitrospirales bacterium]|nr:MAG: hypothetical protein NPIRA01_05020 [Nitrospirales bacterium]
MRTCRHTNTTYSILILQHGAHSPITSSDFLVELGYAVDTVTSWKDAIIRVKQKRYDTLLLDVETLDFQQLAILNSFNRLAIKLPIHLLIQHVPSDINFQFQSIGEDEFLWKSYENYQRIKALQQVKEKRFLRKIAETTTLEFITFRARYQSIVRTAQDAIILGNQDGHILSWNSSAEHMFGYRAKDILGKPLTFIMPDRYHSGDQQKLEQFQGYNWGHIAGTIADLQGVKGRGEEFPIKLLLSHSEKTNDVFFCELIRDISERKKLERDLEERNCLLALNTEIGQIVSQEHELSTFLQKATESFVRHLDAIITQIWTHNPQDHTLELQGTAEHNTQINYTDRPRRVDQFNITEIAETGKSYFTNTVIGDPHVLAQEWARQEYLVAFAGYPLQKNQKIIGVLALGFRYPISAFMQNSLEMTANHITTAIERNILFDTHLKIAKYNERILASTEEGIYWLDPEGKMVFINPAGAKLLGYEVQELVGASIHETAHQTNTRDSHLSQASCLMCHTVKSGEIHHSENAVLRKKDHTHFSVNYTSTPVWENEQLVGTFVTFQDITEQTRLAIQQQEDAKLAEVTRVLGDITHDMKNMLMPVLNGAKLLEEELREHFSSLSASTGKETLNTIVFTHEAIGMIINNAWRLHRQVREIADTVKGTISPPKFTPCRLSEVVEEVFASLRLYTSDKNISLHARMLDSLPIIHGDKTRLFNALYNLVYNAIPEMPSGGTVTITGQTGPAPLTLTLAVTDTGNGMHPEIRDRLFSRETISRKMGGTGLGTKIIKDIVEAHGGTITVESEQGKGTTFTLNFPVPDPTNL